MASSINASTSGPGGVITTADNSGILNLQSGGNTVATVNSAGMTTVGTINVPNTFGFKNRLINAEYLIDQRYSFASVTCAANAVTYTLDRFYVYSAGSTLAAIRVANYYGTSYGYQITGNSGNTTAVWGQRIEAANCYDLAGQTVTVSFIASSTSITSLNISCGYPTSGNDNWNGGTTNYLSQNVTINSTPTKYSVTFTVPSAATTGNRVEFNFGALTSGTATIGSPQLELGSQATSFDFRSIGTELALCQRYYENTYPSGTAVGSSVSQAFIYQQSVSAINNYIPGSYVYKVTKRAAPTVTFYNRDGTNGTWLYGLEGQSETGYTPGNITSSPHYVGWYSNIGTTSANVHYGMITASAEL